MTSNVAADRVAWNLNSEPVRGLVARAAAAHTFAQTYPDDQEAQDQSASGEAYEEAAVHVAAYWLPGMDRAGIRVYVRRAVARLTARYMAETDGPDDDDQLEEGYGDDAPGFEGDPSPAPTGGVCGECGRYGGVYHFASCPVVDRGRKEAAAREAFDGCECRACTDTRALEAASTD